MCLSTSQDINNQKPLAGDLASELRGLRGTILQVFYQGIDKVSKALEHSPHEDEPQGGLEGEGSTNGGEGGTAEGGDAVAEDIEAPAKKDEDDQDEDAEGEATEMTDEELAARCVSIRYLNHMPFRHI